MTSTTFDTVFDTSKPIFLLEVINAISEAAKEQMDKLKKAFKKRAELMQSMISSLAKLGKSSHKSEYATEQSDRYGEVLTPGEIAALLNSGPDKSHINGKSGGSNGRS